MGKLKPREKAEPAKILTTFSQNSADFKIRPLCLVCWTMRMVVVTITVVAVICYGLEQGSAPSFLEEKGTGSQYFRLCRPDNFSGTCRQVSVGDWFQDLCPTDAKIHKCLWYLFLYIISFKYNNPRSVISLLLQMRKLTVTQRGWAICSKPHS